MKRTCLLRTFLLFVFYASLLLTLPQYVECEDLYPDELPDLLAMPGDVFAVSRALKCCTAVPLLSDALGHSPEWYRSESVSRELATATLVLIAILRC